MSEAPAGARAYEYIVVGSGAGGGTVAARLAEAGRSVLLLEAGGDPNQVADPRLPEDYQVPAFHAFASENPAMRWDFFVRHYADEQRQLKDTKYSAAQGGVLYPRAGTLGGCTAHNAMIFVYPHNQDWDDIAQSTGDSSWRADNMRRYFELLEDCRHRPLKRWIAGLTGFNPSRHGFDGWLTTEVAMPMESLGNRHLRKVLEELAQNASAQIGHRLKRLRSFFKTRADPNDWRQVKGNASGLRLVPLTTRDHTRIGSRERIVSVAEKFPERLQVECHALATRVLLDSKQRATGVEYLKGERLYRAHADCSESPGELRQARATREVILSGGAFNTPQLLMLSGIGPREELSRSGIEARVDLAGVGKNLQDRYEVSVVNRMKEDWQMLASAKFAKGDSQFHEWLTRKKGVYTTNGGVLAVVKQSKQDQIPDLLCVGLVGNFRGYFPGYSKLIAERQNYLSWIVLKARTINRAGTVTLQSADPRQPPNIDFRYFDEGSDRQGKDLDAVVEGIHFVRAMTKDLRAQGLIASEDVPGEQYQSDDELREFVRDNAWGHHASCSCAIGPRDQGGVLSSDFRVHGTQGLRVVDASVFPRIPGFFIVSAIYMVGEKAADVILASAKN
ncbi:MAG: GMC family oxidoreductase [Candidatus Binatia bacterium]